jgi:ribosomal protein L7/L12
VELTYVLIAAAIIILPIVLARLFSSRSRETDKVMGADRSAPMAAAQAAVPASLSAEVKQLLAQGKKMEAIKLVRERTGAQLAEAKETVESMEEGRSPGRDGPMDVSAMLRMAKELSPEVGRLLGQGRKVDAIKLIRERTGMGLKEAKDIVDRLE